MGRGGIWLLVSLFFFLITLFSGQLLMVILGLWRSRNDARLGGTGPWHKKARGAARDMYEDITFTTLKLVIEDDVRSWRITDWTEEDE